MKEYSYTLRRWNRATGYDYSLPVCVEVYGEDDAIAWWWDARRAKWRTIDLSKEELWSVVEYVHGIQKDRERDYENERRADDCYY